MTQIFFAILLFFVTAGSFTVSSFHFKQKGPLLNNANIFASKKERDSIDKKPYYQQSAIVFFLIGIIFLLNGLQMIFANRWLFYAALAVEIATVIYAIVSAIWIERKGR